MVYSSHYYPGQARFITPLTTVASILQSSPYGPLHGLYYVGPLTRRLLFTSTSIYSCFFLLCSLEIVFRSSFSSKVSHLSKLYPLNCRTCAGCRETEQHLSVMQDSAKSEGNYTPSSNYSHHCNITICL